MTSTSEKPLAKFQSSAFLLLLVLLGTRALVEGNCAKKGDSIVCTKTSKSSSYSTSSSYSSTYTITTHSSTQIDVPCVSRNETDVNGTRHFTNCVTSGSGGVVKSDEDSSQAQASESAPSLEEALTPLSVPPVDSFHASVNPKSSPSPVFFSVCGYHQPTNPHSSTTTTPCVSKNPVQPTPAPSPLPAPVPPPAPSPEPLSSPAVVVHPKIKKRTDKAPVMVLPIVAKRTNSSEVITKRMRNAISSGNFTSVSQEVIESDDIYGLTMGLIFTENDKGSALVKTPQRNRDGDVVAIKGLLSAGLNKHVKSKVVQLLVLAVTSPTGYHFSQFRPLIEHLTEIVEDNALLLEIIKANPQTYSRRMLLCAGCSPVYSFVCAHCWPQKLCQAYYWCPKTNIKSSSSKPGSKPPTKNSKPKPRSSSKDKEQIQFKEESNEEAKEEEKVKGETEAVASIESPILETKEKHSSKAKHKITGSKSKASEFGSSSKQNSAASDENQGPGKKTTKTDKASIKGSNKKDRS